MIVEITTSGDNTDRRKMLTKEKFEEYISNIKKMSDAQNMINEVLDLFCEDNALYFSIYEDLIVNLLEEIFCDKAELISYFIYDCNYGEKTMNCSFEGESGYKFEITNTDQLYTVLIYNYDCEHQDKYRLVKHILFNK